MDMELLAAELPTPPSSSPTRPLLSPDSDDFDFDFSRHLLPDLALPAADELFQGGVIRPLHPHVPSPTTPNPAPKPRPPDPKTAPRHQHRVSKSLSPLRVSEFALHQSSSSFSSSSSSSSLSSPPSKWRLKDLLLFRSASEGRERAAKLTDPLKKSSSVSAALFACIGSSYDTDSSFRYAIGEGEAEGSSSRRRLRYHRPAEEHHDPKKNKTTSLQNKHRLLDCMGFNSSSSSSDHQELSRRSGPCFTL